MAHYIAELIVEAERAEGEEKRKKSQQCSEEILRLWDHRHSLPDGKRPFEDLEPIFRALKSLDPENTSPRYLRGGLLPQEEPREEEVEARKWLALADGMDATAKMLIGACLKRAAETALNKAVDWVALAEEASAEDSFELVIIQFIVDKPGEGNEEDASEPLRKMLRERLERLRAFLNMASMLEREMSAEFDRISSSADQSDASVAASRTE